MDRRLPERGHRRIVLLDIAVLRGWWCERGHRRIVLREIAELRAWWHERGHRRIVLLDFGGRLPLLLLALKAFTNAFKWARVLCAVPQPIRRTFLRKSTVSKSH